MVLEKGNYHEVVWRANENVILQIHVLIESSFRVFKPLIFILFLLNLVYLDFGILKRKLFYRAQIDCQIVDIGGKDQLHVFYLVN